MSEKENFPSSVSLSPNSLCMQASQQWPSQQATAFKQWEYQEGPLTDLGWQQLSQEIQNVRESQVFPTFPSTGKTSSKHIFISLVSFSPLTVAFYLSLSSRMRQIETVEVENKQLVCSNFSERLKFYDTKYSFASLLPACLSLNQGPA